MRGQAWAPSENQVFSLARHFDFRGKHGSYLFATVPGCPIVYFYFVSAQIEEINRRDFAPQSLRPTGSPFRDFRRPPVRVGRCSAVNCDADYNATHARQQRRPSGGIKNPSTTNTPSKCNSSVLMSRRIM